MKTFEKNLFVQERALNGKFYIMLNYKVFELNELGVVIWELLDDEMDLERLTDKIIVEYDVEKSVLKNDINEMLEKLSENLLIVEK